MNKLLEGEGRCWGPGVGRGAGPPWSPEPLVICFVNGAKGGGGWTYLEFLYLGGLLL